MRIVVYSTSSNQVGAAKQIMIPSCADSWDYVAGLYPEDEIIYVINGSSGVGTDTDEHGNIINPPGKVRFIVLDRMSSVDEFVDQISALNPDVVVSLSDMGLPDWNSIKDGLIGEELEAKGIHTIFNRTFTSIAAFDKWRTHIVLDINGFSFARGIYVHHNLLWEEKTNPAVLNNVYKEYILKRISRNFNYPLIMKDTTGAGSMGIKVLKNYEEAEAAVLDPDTNADFMVEEMIIGEQFGCEVHGTEGQYSVLPPFQFSTNSEGVTEPMKSVKFGPVTDPAYHIPELQKEIRRMAEVFHFGPTAEVDLAFRDGKWYVIEINPRFSGMTKACAIMEQRNPYQIVIDPAEGVFKDYSDPKNCKYTISFKSFKVSEENISEIYKQEHVKNIWYVSGYLASFVEIVLGGFDSAEEIIPCMNSLNQKFPGLVDPGVIEHAQSVIGH